MKNYYFQSILAKVFEGFAVKDNLVPRGTQIAKNQFLTELARIPKTQMFKTKSQVIEVISANGDSDMNVFGNRVIPSGWHIREFNRVLFFCKKKNRRHRQPKIPVEDVIQAIELNGESNVAIVIEKRFKLRKELIGKPYFFHMNEHGNPINLHNQDKN